MTMDEEALVRALRKAGGTADATRALLFGIPGEAIGGIAGLSAGAMSKLRGGEFARPAADTSERVSRFISQPWSEAGQEALEGVGKGAKDIGKRIADTGAGKAAIEAAKPAREGWEKYSQQSPAAAATLLAVTQLADRTKLSRAEGAAERTAGRAAQRGAIDVGDKPPKDSVREDLEKALEGFGEGVKGREAKVQERLKEGAKKQAAGKVERASGAGKREKRDPTQYRQLYEREGLDAVLKAGERGEHLIPNPEGGYVGAPRHVLTRRDLADLRRRMDEDYYRSERQLAAADPERKGTWYHRAKAANAEISEPHQLDRGLEQTGGYSAGVAPESELAFRLKHQNMITSQLEPEGLPYRKKVREKLKTAVKENVPVKLSAKVGEYRGKNDPRIKETSPFGVNDFRRARGMEYSDPSGKLVKAINQTAHPVMDVETALQVQRTGAPSGAVLQEVPWVSQKAEDIYNRGKKGRFAGGVEGMVRALREANNTIADYLPKHTMSITHESVPGANTGHMRQVAGMSPDEKRAYAAEGDWSTPAPMAAMDFNESPQGPIKAGTVGAGDRDEILRSLGFMQRPVRQGEGHYVNSLGEAEGNDLTIARPLVDFATGTDQRVNPNTMQTLRAGERLRGLVDAQEAVAGNMPVTMQGRQGKTGYLLEREQLPTSEELANVQSLLEGSGMSAVPTDRGLNIIAPDYWDEATQKAGSRFAGKMGEQISDAFPGAGPMMPAGNEGFYIPGVTTPERHAGKGVATARVLREFAKAPEAAAKNVGESEGVRRSIGAKRRRDERLGGARPDIQKTREFFEKKDWPRVVALMRQGMKPAAAMAALGYSLQGMAAEEPQR